METKYIATIFLAVAMMMPSCSKDGDIIYTDGPDTAQLEGTSKDIVLEKDNLDALVLSVYWNENGNITLSDPLVASPSNAATNVLQMASNETFTGAYEETMDRGVYVKQYTCRQLNSIMSRIGVEGGSTAKIYVRVKTTVGENIAPTYSNVLSMNVTTYYIDMSRGYVLDASRNDTGITLISKNLDGVYTGFMGVAGWYNWWLMEGNNVIWGNQGVDGKAFYLDNTDSGAEVWNFWFPGVAGCYYVTVDTNKREWSSMLIPTLTLGGDLSGEMTYNRKSNQWTYTFVAEAKSYNVTLGGTGKLYNIATGTDDEAAIDTVVAFNGSEIVFGQSASAFSFEVAEVGESTIVLDLSEPSQPKFEVVSGSGGQQNEVPQLLYLSGIYGEWTFDWYLRLYDEDRLNYGGVLPVNSQWGYKMYPEANNWDLFYTMVDGGTAYDGNLTMEGKNNITAPSAGTYMFDVSLSDMKYKVIKVTSVSYTGLNDDWSLTPMTATEQPSVYTAMVTKRANTPWGVKIVLNNNWDLFFGGRGTPGNLFLYREGFEGDNELANGTYLLTVDLAKGTYSYTAQ